MKKFIIKGLKITGITFGVLLLILILIPILFGKQIKQAVKDYINAELNAEVYFEDIGISVFSNFPNITVTLDEFGIVGKGEFAGDTLVDVQHFGVVVNLWSVFGEKYQVNKIALDVPRIHAKVLKNGKPNWDIMKPSADSAVVATETPDSAAPAAPLNLDLRSYAITNGHIIYDDHFGDMFMEIKNLNHSGNGDFQDDNYDFETYTSADAVTLEMEGTSYMNKMKLDADLTLGIDNKTSQYTLKDNRIGLNALNLHFDGWVKMMANSIAMDMKFGTNENTFKSILSMVPGMFTKDFATIDTDGTFALDGVVKGNYSEKSLPGFNVHLGVEKGRFRYPDLPEEVKDINFDLKVDCPKGDLNKLTINFPKFHALFGTAPIDMRCVIKDLMSENMNIDAQAKAALDLANLSKMFPMEGQEMRGKFTVDGTAKGTVNATAGTFPIVNAILKLEQGYFKNADFPSALENMSMDASMKCDNGNMAASTLTVRQFHTEIDGAPVDATLSVNDFADPQYDLLMKGALDLQKLDKIYPIEGTTMKGQVVLDLKTSGRVSDIENERYAKLPTSGTMSITGMDYKSTDLPQGLAISNAKFTFNPDRINIDQYQGRIGSSPVTIGGSLQNYLAYMMVAGQKIKGNLTLTSARFNTNEWLVEEGETVPSAEANVAPAEDVPMEVFEVPADIDFTFACNIKNVIYNNLNFSNMQGDLIMRDQEVRFQNLSFNALGGQMRLSGGYNTKNIAKPAIDLDMGMTGVDIQETYKAFELVQSIAPVAKFVNGKLSSMLRLKGILLGDMSPDLASITSVGDLVIGQGKLKGFKATEMIADKIKLENLREITLDRTKVLFEVHDGRVWVEPFDVAVAAGKMVVKGSHGIDQTMDYDLDFDVPAGAAGAAAMQAVSGLLKKDMGSGDKLRVRVGLGGTTPKPKITYVKTSATDAIAGIKEEVKEKVEEKIEEVKEKVEEKVEEVKEKVEEKIDDAKEKAKAQAQKIMKDAEAAAAKIRKEGKTAAQKLRDEANKQADDIEKSAKNPFEKAAKKKAADAVRKTGDDKAKKVEQDADKQADKVLADARAKSDALLK